MTSIVDQETDALDIDPIWTTSRTARQIYALGEVEKARYYHRFRCKNFSLYILQDITRLLSLAASSISLLTLPQTDGPNDNLPQGEERSEQFVLEVSEYFERLDVSSVPQRIPLSFNPISCFRLCTSQFKER